MRIRERLLVGLIAGGILGLFKPIAAPCGEGLWQPRWYAWIDAGATFIDDTYLEAQEQPVWWNPDGSPAIGPGSTNRFNVAFDPGFWVGLGGGFEFNRWIALELESGFSWNSIASMNWIESTGDTQVLSGYTDGSLYQVPLMPRVVLKYPIALGNEQQLVPMIGGGAGVTFVGLDLDGLRILSDGLDTDFRTSDTESAFTYQAFAGIRYDFKQNMSLGLFYRYSGVESISLEPEWSNPNLLFFSHGDSVWMDDLHTHSVSLAFLWRF